MPKQKAFFAHNNQGFTLVELLTVIFVIGLLGTLMFVAVRVAQSKMKISNAKHDIDQIFKAVILLADDSGEWPGHQKLEVVCSDLVPGPCPANNEICGIDKNSNTCVNSLKDAFAGLTADDAGNSYANWNGPYLRPKHLEDPWGSEYFFDTDYSVDINMEPCSCGGGGCDDVAVIGSYGPDKEGVPSGSVPGAYGCDDIIKIIAR